MHAALQSFLWLLHRFLSFGLMAAFGNLLLRSTFLSLCVLLLPLFVQQDHVHPALLVLGRAALPVAGIFLTRLLPALATFLAVLFPPALFLLGITHLLVPLAKAEPISGQQWQRLRDNGFGNVCEKQPYRRPGQGRRRRRGAPGTGAGLPLQPLRKTMVRQALTLQPAEVYAGAVLWLYCSRQCSRMQPLSPSPQQDGREIGRVEVRKLVG